MANGAVAVTENETVRLTVTQLPLLRVCFSILLRGRFKDDDNG